MNTTTLLYWFDVIGNLAGLTVFFFVLSILSAIIFAIMGFCAYVEDDENPFEHKVYCKCIKVTAYTFLISLLGVIFIPSTKQLYLMYGIGTTIDYLKSNDTANQIPDKAIKALDAWLDMEMQEKEKE